MEARSTKLEKSMKKKSCVKHGKKDNQYTQYIHIKKTVADSTPRNKISVVGSAMLQRETQGCKKIFTM
jgi:hypothetical protein